MDFELPGNWPVQAIAAAVREHELIPVERDTLEGEEIKRIIAEARRRAKALASG